MRLCWVCRHFDGMYDEFRMTIDGKEKNQGRGIKFEGDGRLGKKSLRLSIKSGANVSELELEWIVAAARFDRFEMIGRSEGRRRNLRYKKGRIDG